MSQSITESAIYKSRENFWIPCIINYYASTELTDYDIRDDFYDSLKRTFDNLPRNCIQIMVGDLNAQVGREEVCQSTAEKKSLYLESNNNGVRLISFAAS